MNTAYFIAHRIALNNQKSFSGFIIKLSITATALSVAAMIIAMSFVNGFQQAVANKVFSFWGHIQVQHYQVNKSLVSEENPIEKNTTVENQLKSVKNIKGVYAFATKSTVIEKDKTIESCLFKGVDAGYDSTRLHNFLLQGRWLQFTDSGYCKEIIISAYTAKELNIKLHDTVRIFFVSNQENNTIYRPLKVVGIYKTGIEEYDKIFALGDIKLIQYLSNWQNNTIGGYEVVLNNYKQTDEVLQQINLPVIWNAKSIQEVNPTIFDWLKIQDVNRDVMFIIMAIVAIINLITCLLILVLERLKMVGILKALGTPNSTIENIFVCHAFLIAATGIIIGFLLGVGICLLQQQTGFITLDEANYYVAVAPVKIVWWQVIAVCIAVGIICLLSLLLPAAVVRKISIVKTIQFR